MKNRTRSGESVETTVKLTGEYEQIAEIIGVGDYEYEELEIVMEDLEAVLKIIVQTGGATRSRIAEELKSLDTSTAWGPAAPVAASSSNLTESVRSI